VKSIALSLAIFAASGFLAWSAQAFDGTRNSGKASYSQGIAGPCPPGTCNQKGGPNANNMKQCSAENCGRKKRN
jgi:hypothetical protein